MSHAYPSTEPATRICPQCGTETQLAVCKKDGFATVERARYVKRVAVERAGEVLAGRWRLDSALRVEPLGVTYQAWDTSVGRPCAVRLLAPEIGGSLERIARFQREGRFLASLAHPSIARVYEHGVTPDGTLFVAEELVVGESLADVIARGPLLVSEVVGLGKELFDALVEAHAHGVQHRSLSLADVRVLPGGGYKISGFGWVKILADDQPAFTFPRELAHAFATMAPEQARGKGVSGHADLYSVGAVLYAALTGVLPFGDGTPTDLLVAHAVKMPKLPERDGRPQHGPLPDLVMRCLEKKPWNRPDGAQAALEALERCAARPFQHTDAAAFADTPAPTAAMQSALERAQLERAQTSATAERSAERPALPAAAMPSVAPRIVRAVRSESPTSLPEPVKTGEALRPAMHLGARRTWLWLLALVLAVAGGVALGVVLSRGGDAPAPVAWAPPSEGALQAGAPGIEPVPLEAIASPRPSVLDPDVTGPSPSEPALPSALAQPTTQPPTWPEPTARGEPGSITIGPPPAPNKPAAPPKKAATNRTKPEPEERADRPPTTTPPSGKDPFADLEDPSVAPDARPPAVARKVLVDSDPPGATVSIDGRAAGQTPLYVEWDDIGLAINIRLDKAGYRTLATSLGPKTGRAVFLELKALDAP